MPTERPGHDRSKVLSVRLTTGEFDRLTAEADELGVGPSTLARTLIRQGLATRSSEAKSLRGQSYSPLEEKLFSELTARVEALERWVADH